jgi:hypothetical protein
VSWIYLRENPERIRGALLNGHVDEVVALRGTAPDELAAAMHPFGYGEQLAVSKAALDVDGDGVPDEPRLHELAVLPLLCMPNPNQAPTYPFQDRVVPRFLRSTMSQIRG